MLPLKRRMKKMSFVNNMLRTIDLDIILTLDSRSLSMRIVLIFLIYHTVFIVYKCCQK